MLKGEVKRFWDLNPCGGRWKDFKEKMEWALETENYIYEILSDKLLHNKKVLEIGCGQGMVLAFTSKKCKEIIGIDISMNSLKSAQLGIRELDIKNAKLILSDAENLPFKNESFDVVYSIGVLHHTPDTQRAVDEIFRVLKYRGKVVIMLYRKYNPKWLVVVLIRYFSKIVDLIMRKNFYLANKLRKKYVNRLNSPHGTALLELLGCPILKMFSKKQVKKMFQNFQNLEIKIYQVGFSRLFDFLPDFLKGRVLKKIFKKVDKMMREYWGFYIVVMGNKYSL